MTPMLLAAGVRLSLGGRQVLDDIGIALFPGRFTVLAGPNGSGKSSLLKVLSGERKPQAGRITLSGQPLGSLPPLELARRRAVLPQSSAVAFPFTAEEIVRFAVEQHCRSAAEARRIVQDALERVQMDSFATRVFFTLSGGEQQRVLFARAAAQLRASARSDARQCLLLDEPTSSLDLEHQLLVLNEARRLCRAGVGVLAVLHDLQLVRSVADDVVVLVKGVVRARGAPAEVLSRELVRDVFRVELEADFVPRLPFRGQARGEVSAPGSIPAVQG